MKDKKRMAAKRSRKLEQHRHGVSSARRSGPQTGGKSFDLVQSCPELGPVYQRFGRTVPAGTPTLANAQEHLTRLLAADKQVPPLEVAAALLQVARAHLADGQPLAAKAPLAEAERLFEQDTRSMSTEEAFARGHGFPFWPTTVEWIRVQIQLSAGQEPAFSRLPEKPGLEIDRVDNVHLAAYIFLYFGFVYQMSRDTLQQKEALALIQLIVDELNSDEPDVMLLRVFGSLFMEVLGRTGAEDDSMLTMIRGFKASQDKAHSPL